MMLSISPEEAAEEAAAGEGGRGGEGMGCGGEWWGRGGAWEEGSRNLLACLLEIYHTFTST